MRSRDLTQFSAGSKVLYRVSTSVGYWEEQEIARELQKCVELENGVKIRKSDGYEYGSKNYYKRAIDFDADLLKSEQARKGEDEERAKLRDLLDELRPHGAKQSLDIAKVRRIIKALES